MTTDTHVSADLYPFESRYFDRDGMRYHYLDEGTGQPVICVHGNPTWSFYYRNLVRAFRNRYRCIVPDHIGCGLSDKPGDDTYRYTLDSRVDDLEALLDHLGLDENLTFVVHDWGGAIGLGAALRRPEAIKRVILFNTAAFHMPGRKKLPAALWIARNLSPISAVLIRGLNAFATKATTMATTKPMPPDVKVGYLAPYNSWKNRIATLRFVQDIPLRSTDPSFAAISRIEDKLTLLRDVPTLICWGEKDFVFDMDFLAEWKARLPDAEVHTYPNAGHYVLEDAFDEILPVVRDFLDTHPVPVPNPDPVETAP